MAEQKKGWVSGRTRESADGLGRRPRNKQEEQRLREAADKARQQAQNRGRSGGHRDR